MLKVIFVDRSTGKTWLFRKLCKFSNPICLLKMTSQSNEILDWRTHFFDWHTKSWPPTCAATTDVLYTSMIPSLFSFSCFGAFSRPFNNTISRYLGQWPQNYPYWKPSLLCNICFCLFVCLNKKKFLFFYCFVFIFIFCCFFDWQWWTTIELYRIVSLNAHQNFMKGLYTIKLHEPKILTLLVLF